MEYVSVQGEDVPKVGLGTWRLSGDECRETVETALDLGYRHIDTAQSYGNERAVGDAVRESDVDREDVFLATKLDSDHRTYDAVLRGAEESLSRLGTSYVDLLLIHWPNDRFPFGATPHVETLDAMNDLVERGKVEHVGVSNYNVELLDEARALSDAPVFTDQVQFHPYWDQTELLDYCDIHDVLVTAYSPLAHGGVLDDHVLAEIAKRHDRSPAQVALRWVLQHDNTVTIPKASSRDHLEANLAVFDFELTDAEMDRIFRPSKLRTASKFIRSRLGV